MLKCTISLMNLPRKCKHVSNSIIPDLNISKCKSVLLEIYFIETETEQKYIKISKILKSLVK